MPASPSARERNDQCYEERESSRGPRPKPTAPSSPRCGGIFIDRGFDELVIPAVWEQQTFTARAGPEILNQMYAFEDKRGRPICLIPEVTAIVQERWRDSWAKTQPRPYRVFYESRCYRYERPQRGRYREFTQVGVEILGGDPAAGLTEAKQTLIGLLEVLGLEYEFRDSVRRGLTYYTSPGFEVECDRLGAQKQVAGGGPYAEGVGWADIDDQTAVLEASCAAGGTDSMSCDLDSPCATGLLCAGIIRTTVLASNPNGLCLDSTYRGVFTGGAVAIPTDGATAEITMQVAGLTTVDMDVTILLDLDHPAPQELVIELRNPDGNVVSVANLQSTELHPGGVPIVPAGFSGDESVNGTWALIVRDTVDNDNNGSVHSWDLEIMSRFD